MVTTTPQSIFDWFGAPQLESPVSTRRARSLWAIAWSFYGLLAVMLTLAIAAAPATLARRGTSILMVGVLMLALHSLNRRGRTTLASWIFVLGLATIVTQRAWYAGGLHAPVALFYLMFVLMAAELLGVRGSVVVAGACVVSATVLGGFELAGWLPPAPPSSSAAVLFLAILTSLMVTLSCLMLLVSNTEHGAADDLVNMFVHDMRSPLTVLMGRLALLRDGLSHAVEPEGHVEAAMAEAMRLNRMANNLLDITRLQNHRLAVHRSATDVADLARDVVRRISVIDASRCIEVDAPAAVVCDCDADILRRVIENLVTNALKHTPRAGRVVVRVSSRDACVRFSVQDEGAGIPREERDAIFRRYSATRMHARSGQHSVGLGLAFCRVAVAAHGGRIWVEDAVPHGSVFIAELPSGE